MMDAPYGLWDSPISAEMASSAIVSFQDVAIDGEDIYWSEMRPAENGRYVIVKRSPNNQIVDVLPPEFNARTRVHEYGGAAFGVHQGVIYFTNYQDQQVYKIAPNQKPVAITQAGIRFADFQFSPNGVVAIAESHVDNHYPKNFIALINPERKEIKTLVQGNDFYAFPTLDHDGKKIAWIAWNQPSMPWDETQLWVGDLNNSEVTNITQIDSTDSEQAFFQPQFGLQNQLLVVSDKSNWWNLYQVKGKTIEKLFSVDSEIGQPLWNLGASTWAFYENSIVCTFSKNELGQLFLYQNNALKSFDLPYNRFSQIRTKNNKMVMIATANDKPSVILLIENGKPQILRESAQVEVDKDNISIPRHITFSSKDHRESYAYFYPPKNKLYRGLPNTLPPLIVKSHGGPTANSGSNFNLDIQYWTSRGFAVVDVNYAGSTGYGRKYRKSLEKNWGIYDVQDCEAAALYLANQGLVDINKLAITGGSAGGFTTLAALTFTDTFKVGASHYGVSDLEALEKETHKFEARYLDRLIGPYPKEKHKFQERSPIHHIEHLSAPIIFFQGDEDKIVPPMQAELMVKALKEKGIKTEYILFEGEQHGFRKAQNRIKVLEEQRKFFIEALNLK